MKLLRFGTRATATYQVPTDHSRSDESGADGKGKGRTRGQSLTEMAMLLPVLVLLLSVLIEGGFALNAWIRVNSAARDAVRFAMDAGRPQETGALIQSKLQSIEFGSGGTYTSSTNIDAYIISGRTDGSGNIILPWSVTQVVTSSNSTRTPRVLPANIQNGLRTQGTGPAQDMPFTIVEVDFRYQPLLATVVARGSNIPMSSYAIVQQYTN